MLTRLIARSDVVSEPAANYNAEVEAKYEYREAECEYREAEYEYDRGEPEQCVGPKTPSSVG